MQQGYGHGYSESMWPADILSGRAGTFEAVVFRPAANSVCQLRNISKLFLLVLLLCEMPAA